MVSIGYYEIHLLRQVELGYLSLEKSRQRVVDTLTELEKASEGPNTPSRVS